MVLSHEISNDYWVIDFDTSFHATYHKDYCTDYVQGDFGYVLLSNDLSCKIKGIGNITIKMPNENR